MEISDAQRQLLVLCAIRLDGVSPDWSLLARETLRDGGLAGLVAGDIVEDSAQASSTRPILRAGAAHRGEAEARVDEELAVASRAGARLVTVLDDDYPANLRLIPNLPPFLFTKGTVFEERDLRSVAVVGTRDATEAGLKKASKMAHRLVEEDVTVVSGLARGIDTAAHTATLDVGGRTIAVIGTGISRVYPAENTVLAGQIAEHGVIVSQFWPSAQPATWTFPRRNVVMSGIAQGTVVIEASATSGAKMQARLALEHGKRAFLLRSLVETHSWARKYLERGAIEVHDVDDVVRHLAEPARIVRLTEQRSQLSLL